MAVSTVVSCPIERLHNLAFSYSLNSGEDQYKIAVMYWQHVPGTPIDLNFDFDEIV